MMKRKDAIGKSITVHSNLKSILIKYGISIGIATGMVILTLWLHDFWKISILVDQYRLLTDAFTIPGITFILLGCLVALSNEGALSAIGWMLKRMFKFLNPFSDKNIEKYSEYVANKKRVTGYSFLFYTGILFSAISVVFLILFYSVYTG